MTLRCICEICYNVYAVVNMSHDVTMYSEARHPRDFALLLNMRIHEDELTVYVLEKCKGACGTSNCVAPQNPFS